MPLPVELTGPLEPAVGARAQQGASGHQRELKEEAKVLNPITVEVAQAFFEEDLLRVKVRLSTRTALDAEQLAVAVIGLKEGEVVDRVVQQLSKSLEKPMLEKDDVVILDFSLPGKGLTEYQIRGSWGEHAQRVLREQALAEGSSAKAAAAKAGIKNSAQLSPAPEPVGLNAAMPQRPDAGRARMAEVSVVPQEAPAAPARPLALENVELEGRVRNCGADTCPIVYTIHAELVNRFAEALGEIELAVGLYWTDEGRLPVIPAYLDALTSNEERIPLGRLLLEPGGRKRIRITVDRDVPQVPGGEFIPHLRVLRYVPLIPEPEIRRY